MNFDEVGILFKEDRDIKHIEGIYGNLVSIAKSIMIKKNSKYVNDIDVSDIVADAFIKIYDKIDQFDPELGSFKSWVYTIIMNLILGEYRKIKNLVSFVDDEEEKLPFFEDYYEEENMFTANDINDAFETFIPSKYIRASSNRLIDIDTQFQIYKEFVSEDLSYKEIINRYPDLNLTDSILKRMFSRMRINFLKYLMIKYPEKEIGRLNKNRKSVKNINE